MPTVLSLGSQALIEIGVLEAGDSLSPQQGSMVLPRVQGMLDAWAADRLTLSVQQVTSFVLTSGTSTVTLGPGGVVPMVRPMYIDHVNYVIPGAVPAIEVPMGALDFDSYATLRIKALPSALPLWYYYQTDIATVFGNLFIYPQVTQNVTLKIYSPQAVGIPLALTDNLIGPAGYAEGFLYSLALRLCGPFGVTPPPLLTGLADRAMAALKRPNVAPGVLGVDPALAGHVGGAYNILADTGG